MRQHRRRSTKNALVLIGFGLGALYWALESALHAFVLGEGEFVRQLLPREWDEVWTRLLIFGFIVGFGFVARSVVANRERGREALRESERRIRERFEERTRQLARESEQVAVLHERERLARDLHDSVTQTLFSAGLIADALPRLWERDPDRALAQLREMRGLMREALLEMRALLLELRPESIADADLGEMLRRLSTSDDRRPRIDVDIEGRFSGTAELKTALYRIASEAVANASRHSGASRVQMMLRSTQERIELSVADNGLGFDPARVGLEHLGLGFMRERAEEAGLSLRVESQEGRGTRITAVWPHSSARLP